MLARRVVGGLATASGKGVVHRDLKPANLFLRAGSLDETKILDFGLARRMGDAQVITRTGLVVGTPLYMSPEQARGLRKIDTGSDVFSLGCVLYECLSGRAPFEGSNALATLAKICLEEPAALRRLERQVPQRLANLVHAMLAKDVSDRPSWRAISEQLTRIASLGGDSTTPSAPPTNAPEARALRARGQQRVLCTVIVGRSEPLGLVQARAANRARMLHLEDAHADVYAEPRADESSDGQLDAQQRPTCS